jgi:hypothetical protein
MLFTAGDSNRDARHLIRDSPCALNPAVITITVSGLSDSFQQDYRATEWNVNFGAAYTTFSLRKSPTKPDGLRLIPFSPNFANARGVYEYTGAVATSVDLMDRGRGFAQLSRTEPAVLGYAAVGSGAEISVSLSPVTDEVDNAFKSHWEVSSLAVAAGKGSGYNNLQPIVILPSEGSICASAATGQMKVDRGQPTLAVSVKSVSPCDCDYPGATVGTDAVFNVRYESRGTTPSTWRVSAVDVVSPGQGYTDGLPLIFTAGLHDTITTAPVASISVTDGAVTGVTVTSGGVAFKSGVPTGVVQGLVKGAYYKEDASLPPYIYSSDLAKWGLTVDSTVHSPTFGQVLSATVVEQPLGEEAVEGVCEYSCLQSMNGSFTLTADDPSVIGDPDYFPLYRAVNLCVKSPIGSGARLRVQPPSGYDNTAVGITEVAFDPLPGSSSAGGTGYAEQGRVMPVYSLAATPGTGASFSYELRQEADSLGRPMWFVSSASVTGGTGYRDNALITATPAGPLLRVRTVRAEPVLDVATCAGGGGATFILRFAMSAGATPEWSVAAVDIANGGGGYSGSVPLIFSFTAPTIRVRDACVLAFANAAGQLDRVEIVNEGAYYLDTGVPDRVDIVSSGPLYSFSADVPVFAPSPTVLILQNSPFSNGSGAEIEAVVDTDTGSPTFGRIVGTNIVSEGSGYVLWCAGDESEASFGLTPETTVPCRSVDGLVAVCGYRLHCDTETASPFGERLQIEMQAEITSPSTHSGGERQAAVVISNRGFGVSDAGYDTGQSGSPGFYCTRVFYGTGADDEITLLPMDGGSGTVTLSLFGDPANRTNICSCCDVRDVNCPPPVLDTESSGESFSAIAQPELPFTQCVDENGVPAENVWVQLAPQYDENGDFEQWVVVCGECPAGTAFSPLPEEAVQPRQKTYCNCLGLGDPVQLYCYWKATYDASITPNLILGTDCTTGVELDFSECENPLP